MTRRMDRTSRSHVGRTRPLSIDADYVGACTCRQFSGGRAVHNFGQPGCRYATER
jgi:hypothetical protein